jgi:hypothetical protein
MKLMKFTHELLLFVAKGYIYIYAYISYRVDL